MKSACHLIEIVVCFGGIAANWYLFGWVPVAIYAGSGIIVTFFGALAKRLP